VTRKARQRRAVMSIDDWCRRHRHQPVKTQHAALMRKLNGHLNYFSVNGNGERVRALLYYARRLWNRWLRRRSQRTRMTWARFNDLLKVFPLPKPTVRVQLWV
jgi:hypothetical protein